MNSLVKDEKIMNENINMERYDHKIQFVIDKAEGILEIFEE